MGKYAEESLFRLIYQLARLGLRWFTLEKEYTRQEVKNLAGRSVPGMIMAFAGIVTVAVAVTFMLIAGSVLIMNIWFESWLSVLIVAGVLLLVGLITALAGGLKARKAVTTARINIGHIREDMLWLKQN